MKITASVLFKDGVQREYDIYRAETPAEIEAQLKVLMAGFNVSMNKDDLKFLEVGTTMVLLEAITVIHFEVFD